MITRIELKNFMSHENSVIEPAAGLTVISGPNNCGKSAIVTALQILCYNDESTFVMRHGEKECSIKVFTDDGHEIEWIRTKSKSTKYLIDGQQFDRLGRGGTPDELHEILKIQKVSCDNQEFDVHFGSQQSPVFLLKDSPRAAAQFFASSSDAINLIGMQTRHKQKVRDRKQEKRRLDSELEATTQKLDKLESVPDLANRLQTLNSDYQELKHREEEIAALHNQIRAIEEKTNQLLRLNSRVDALSQLGGPPELSDTTLLESLLSRTKRNATQWELAEAFCDVLKKIEDVPQQIETEELESLLRRLRSTSLVADSVSRQVAALNVLSELPPQQETAELSHAISQLNRLNRVYTRTERELSVCSDLVGPPSLPATKELDNSLSKISTQLGQFKKLSELFEQLESELAHTKNLMVEWLQVNPSCPTCGTELSRESLFSGGHRHG